MHSQVLFNIITKKKGNNMTFSFFNKPPLSGAEKDKLHYEFTLQHHKIEEKLKNTEVSQQKHFSILITFISFCNTFPDPAIKANSSCFHLCFEYDYVQIFLNNSYLIIKKTCLMNLINFFSQAWYFLHEVRNETKLTIYS